MKWFWAVYWFFKSKRFGRCACCKKPRILAYQIIAYSTYSEWMCKHCADVEQKEVVQAWRDYYSSVL